MAANQKDSRNSLTRNLYTIIVEYQQGTYVAQATGGSPSIAISNWSPAGKDAALAIHLKKIHKRIQDQVQKGDVPARVKNNVNVWCLSGTIEGELYLAHLILTAD
jgi:hypothetical protein